jgi:DNA-binding MarR family transcriptional regulator
MRNLSVNTIYDHLRQFEQRGYINRERGWRNIRVTEKAA